MLHDDRRLVAGFHAGTPGTRPGAFAALFACTLAFACLWSSSVPADPWTWLLLAIAWFATMGWRPLLEPDEGRYAEIPREMTVVPSSS
ncbi:MAG: hypothetical protein WDO56_37075 [Gammaproteobacteria bacterium]